MKQLMALIFIIFIIGCTNCELTAAPYGVTHYPDKRLVNITVGVRCAVIPPGLIKFELFENSTNSTIINQQLPFQGVSGAPEEYTYFNLTLNLSSVQINPSDFYKINLVLPGDVHVGQSFYGELPDNKCILEPVFGDCRINTTTYFFNKSSNRCEEALISICGVDPFNDYNTCQGFCGVRECNESNPCPEGVDCYKFEDQNNSICWEGNPCNRCFYGECEVNDSVVTCKQY